MSCESPLACQIGAIPKSERPQYEQLKEKIFRQIDRPKTIEEDDGFKYTLLDEKNLLRNLGEWMVYEQACCPFFRFDLTVTPNRGPIYLRIGGPKGVKEFLSALVG